MSATTNAQEPLFRTLRRVREQLRAAQAAKRERRRSRRRRVLVSLATGVGVLAFTVAFVGFWAEVLRDPAPPMTWRADR